MIFIIGRYVHLKLCEFPACDVAIGFGILRSISICPEMVLYLHIKTSIGDVSISVADAEFILCLSRHRFNGIGCARRSFNSPVLLIIPLAAQVTLIISRYRHTEF